MRLTSDQNFYSFEDEFSGPCEHHTATRLQLEGLLGSVCLYYAVPDPPLRFINTRRNTHAAWYDAEIVLNRAREGANGWALLHEVTHYLVDEFYDGADHHGPEYTAIYMHLLHRYNYLPDRCFRLLAKKYGIKIGRKYKPKSFI